MTAVPLALARRHPSWPAALLGAVGATGFAPLSLWPLTLLALAGWMLLVFAAPSARAASWRGWLFGFGHFTVNNNWIAHAFDFQANMPPVLGWLAPPALALYLAIYPALAAGLAWRFSAARENGGRPAGGDFLLFGAAWIATEYLRATMFTGYAWDPLGVIWVPVPAVPRLAAWVGTYALSGLTVVAAGGIVLLIRARGHGMSRAQLAGGAALATVLLAMLEMAAPSPPPATPGTPRLRVVQPNIGQDQRGETDGELMFRALASLSGRPGPVPRLLLWPEGVTREFIEDGYPDYIYDGLPPDLARERLARLLGPRDILLTGGTALQFGRQRKVETATNAVFAITPAARIAGRYDKAHLVPYGEYLPMRPLLSAIGLSRLVPGDIDFRGGPGPRAIDLPPFGRIAVQVCYEIIFSGEVVDRAHRPALLFNPSNDAWFGAWGPPQHLAQARMRAMEEGLPIVRATPTGISAVIDAGGRVLARQPLGSRGALELPMPPPGAPTLFSRLGNWMALLVAAALLLLGVAAHRRSR